MVEFMQQGTTIMSEVYHNMLKKEQMKRCGMLTSSVPVVLLHDNACLHTAARTPAFQLGIV
jgi:hypothetical protein